MTIKTFLAIGTAIASMLLAGCADNPRRASLQPAATQVAAYAETHFVVRREGNTATVSEIQDEERLEELSRMLAGLPDSERGREHAAELLAMADAS